MDQGAGELGRHRPLEAEDECQSQRRRQGGGVEGGLADQDPPALGEHLHASFR